MTSGVALYENAMQVVPVLLIAVFLDTRSSDDQPMSRRQRSWERVQGRAFAVLGVIAFMVSLFVVAGVLDGADLTEAIVISALSGCISLLLARIWRRFEHNQNEDEPAGE
jgi:hypothetical protein